MTAAARALYGDFVRTFGNVLFAVSLFVAWGVLTLVGVVVDQGQDPTVYFQNYAAPLARAMKIEMGNLPRMRAWMDRMRKIPAVTADHDRAAKAWQGVHNIAAEFEGPDGRIHWRDSRLAHAHSARQKAVRRIQPF